jgi:hypothetical protein
MNISSRSTVRFGPFPLLQLAPHLKTTEM